MKPGHFKVYSTPLDSFWCCGGTGMENHAKYGDTICFHGTDSLFVNLFLASELTWKARGITLKQETKFPNENGTRLTFTCATPAKLALKIRRLAWTEAATISVNGKAVQTAVPDGYFSIDRTWNTGDVVTVKLPMKLRLEALPDDAKTVAIFYGPILHAGALGTEGLPPENQQARREHDLDKVSDPAAPVFIGTPEKLLASVGRAAKAAPLEFTLGKPGAPDGFLLEPFFRLHHQRYTIYWKTMSEAAPQ